MQKCRFTTTSKGYLFGTYCVYPLCASVATVISLYFLTTLVLSFFELSISKGLGYLTLAAFTFGMLVLTVFLYWLCIQSYRFECREFAISQKGIALGYNQKTKSYYTWTEIPEIAISVFQVAPNRRVYQTVICIFTEPKPRDFSQRIQRYPYGIANVNRFILIDYSENLYNQLAAVYPKEILDYRKEQVR